VSEKPLSPKDRIILPLDFNSFDDAKKAVKKLKNEIGLFKVGLTLYVKEGRKVIDHLQDQVGAERIFLDLKFNDIPETVGGVSSVVERMAPVRFMTVHASEGERVLKAAVEALKEGTGVLGITVLTSITDSELLGLGFSMTVRERVLMLAGFSKKAGCAGVVCSGLEASDVKKKCGQSFVVVAPGIRPAWAMISGDDQRRVMTPAQAVKSGSDYVVIGRPIHRAADPVGAAQKVAEEIEEALHDLPAGP